MPFDRPHADPDQPVRCGCPNKSCVARQALGKPAEREGGDVERDKLGRRKPEARRSQSRAPRERARTPDSVC